METLNKKTIIGLTLYIFVAIFQPPILPYDLIYITLFITVILIGLDSRWKIDLTILRDSGMLFLIKTITILFFYVVIVDVIDVMFIESADLFSNRIRVINQLVVLTGEEILAVYYILTKVKKYQIDKYTLFKFIFIAGACQGILSVVAFLIPAVRNFFLRYSGSIFENAWVLERRGYGLSAILVDTFGYAMALIAGANLLIHDNKKLKKYISIGLMLFSILVNARTGIVVFFVALVLFLQKSDNILKTFIKLAIECVFLAFLYFYIVPMVLEWGVKSPNNTIKWIVSDFYTLYYSSNSTGGGANYDFISSIIGLPDNAFELIFGSGHSVYGTRNILGFATDIGYINLFWTYGILGASVFLLSMLYLMYTAIRTSNTIDMKLIAGFNLIAYFVVLVKGILLGYNPGTMTMYLMIFSILYFNRKENNYV